MICKCARCVKFNLCEKFNFFSIFNLAAYKKQRLATYHSIRMLFIAACWSQYGTALALNKTSHERALSRATMHQETPSSASMTSYKPRLTSVEEGESPSGGETKRNFDSGSLR
jgi:hypothetical protein